MKRKSIIFTTLAAIGVAMIAVPLVGKAQSSSKYFYDNLSFTIPDLISDVKLNGLKLAFNCPVEIGNFNQVSLPINSLVVKSQLHDGTGWVDSGSTIALRNVTIPKMSKVTKTLPIEISLVSAAYGLLNKASKIRLIFGVYTAGFQVNIPLETTLYVPKDKTTEGLNNNSIDLSKIG